jgi:DNA repair ATPase RecN
MHIFEMVAIIACVAIIAGLLKEMVKKQEVEPVDLSEIETRLDEIERLKKRVETLEAIVTDQGYSLKQQINNLD